MLKLQLQSLFPDKGCCEQDYYLTTLELVECYNSGEVESDEEVVDSSLALAKWRYVSDPEGRQVESFIRVMCVKGFFQMLGQFS